MTNGHHPDCERTVLGTMLYHGTQSPERFEVPDGPAWFSNDREVARRFTTWHTSSGRMRPRVLTYRVVETIPTLARVGSEEEFARLLEEHGLSDVIGQEGAEDFCEGRYNGWVIANNYGPGAADVLLCEPERWLRFIRTERS